MWTLVKGIIFNNWNVVVGRSLSRMPALTAHHFCFSGPLTVIANIPSHSFRLMSVFVEAASQNPAWNSNMSVWWPSDVLGSEGTFAHSSDLMCSSCVSMELSVKEKGVIIYSSFVIWHEPHKAWCFEFRRPFQSCAAPNPYSVIPSLLKSCYFCVSLLCTLKIKVRIWVECINLWNNHLCQSGI